MAKSCKAVAETGLDFRVMISPREIERAAINYTAALQSAIDEAVPKIEPNKRRRPVDERTGRARDRCGENHTILIQSGLSSIYKTSGYSQSHNTAA